MFRWRSAGGDPPVALTVTLTVTLTVAIGCTERIEPSERQGVMEIGLTTTAALIYATWMSIHLQIQLLLLLPLRLGREMRVCTFGLNCR